ncbi:hypothetical protein [Vulcanococcus limneticus]|nr:hypothetical protein [Vulcanococcus limneticus]
MELALLCLERTEAAGDRRQALLRLVLALQHKGRLAGLDTPGMA